MKRILIMISWSFTVLPRTLIAFLLFYPAFALKAIAIKDEQAPKQCATILNFAQADPLITLDWNDQDEKRIEITSTDGKDHQFKLTIS